MGSPTFVNEKVVHILEKNNIVLNFETKVRRRLLLYAFKFLLTNIQSELIDKSTIIFTQGWTNSLGTAHSKVGGPTFVNEKLVHIREKNNIVLTFETKEQRRLSLYAFKLILTNIQSELIDKSTIISTRRWTNSLGRAHSRMASPTFVNKKSSSHRAGHP